MSTGISGRSLCNYFLFSIIFKFRHHMVSFIHRNSQSKSHGDKVKCYQRLGREEGDEEKLVKGHRNTEGISFSI